MFKKIKLFLQSYQEKNKVLITIHGFGVRRKHEMDHLFNYGKNHLMDIDTFDLFDIENENDNDYTKWIIVAEKRVQKALSENKKVYLLGFSMGGVIASYLASKYDIEKLVLVSPAFIHFNLENYTNLAIQTGKKIFNNNETTSKPKMPSSFYNGFLNCVKDCKLEISKVKCPILIIQGDEDEVIPTKSSEWAYEHITHNQKKCVFLHKGKHRILMDKNVEDLAFLLIDQFLNDTILPKKEQY